LRVEESAVEGGEEGREERREEGREEEGREEEGREEEGREERGMRRGEGKEGKWWCIEMGGDSMLESLKF
jgi:hypothetical protein